MRPFKALAIAGFAALLAVAAVAVVPETVPSLVAGVRERPESPALVAACWMAATTASIAGKRVLACGALSWRETATAHIVGTVSNRIIPAGAGAGGTYLIALRRGGMTLTAAAAMAGLWAAASGVAHSSGAVVGVVWLYAGGIGVAALATGLGFVAWRGRAYLTHPGRDGHASLFAADTHVGDSGEPQSRTERVMPSADAETRRAGTATDLVLSTRRGRIRQRLGALRGSIVDAVAVIRANPRRAVAAVLAQVGAMSCLAIGFAIAAESFGVPVTMATAMAAYAGGTALSATIPTPAGIGSADAALVGALVMVGSPLSDAVAAVLVFRAVILLAPIVVAAVMALGWTSRLWPRRDSAPVVS